MKYNVGDKVRIQPLEWYQKEIESEDCFNIFDIFWCSREMTISKIEKSQYLMEEDGQEFYWTDEMIEGLVEEEIIDIDDFQDDNEMGDIIDEYVHRLKDNECQINLPEGYIFKDDNGNVINTTKIILEMQKKEYPKTYEECCEILGGLADYVWGGYKQDLFQTFHMLYIYRDAYWKIAGEEMGLDKPWEPDYTNTGEKKFSIWVDFGEIKLGGPFTTTQMVLSFPTSEMRDAFYENFKELINECKELL